MIPFAHGSAVLRESESKASPFPLKGAGASPHATLLASILRDQTLTAEVPRRRTVAGRGANERCSGATGALAVSGMARLTAGRGRQSTGGPGAGASRAIAGILVVLMIGSASWARGGPDLVSLVETLNLGTYTRGDGPPAFTAQTLSGEGVSLASLRGRVVLLNFWATWCRECPEMPVLERLHRELARQGLAVLGINVREEPRVILGFAADLGLTFPLLPDPDGRIQRRYGVIGLPTTFLIGRDGRPFARAIGTREWGSAPARAVIQALLAESVPPGLAR
jgi:peroxiredoxin